MEKPKTYCGDLDGLPETALRELCELPRWVGWRWEPRTDKHGAIAWTKVPYRVSNPALHAKSNDPTTWGHFDTAVAAVKAGKADGVGLVMDGSNIAAIDLDKCRDAKTKRT